MLWEFFCRVPHRNACGWWWCGFGWSRAVTSDAGIQKRLSWLSVLWYFSKLNFLDRLNSKGLDKAQLITIEGKSKQKGLLYWAMKWQRQGKNQRHKVSLQADKLQSKASQSFDILSCRYKIWLHDDNCPWNAEAVFFEKMYIVSLIFSGQIYFCAFPVSHPLMYSSQAQRRKRAAQTRLRTWRAVQTYSLLFFAKSDLSCQANPNLTNGLLWNLS